MVKQKTVSLGGDAVKLTVSKVITALISMIVAMLLSRIRTLEEYGTYSELLIVINLSVSLLMLGLPNSINFFLARADNDSERQNFLSVYYTLSTLFSLICGLCLVLLAYPIVKYFNNPQIYDYLFFLLIFPWAQITSSSIENVLIVYNKANHIVAFRIIHSLVLLLIVLLVKILSLSFMVNMILLVSAEAVFAIAVYVIVAKLSGKIKLCLNKDWIKKIFEFSIPLGLATAMGTLNIELDKIMIGKLFPVEQVAIYTNASKELPVSIIAASLTAVLMPQLTRLLKKDKAKEAIDLWKASIIISFIAICLLSFGCIVYANEVITILYSKKYLAGIDVFRIYCLLLPLRCTYWGIILNSSGKTKFIFYSSVISLLLNLILNYIFYLLFGFIGPAIATVIVVAVLTIIQLVATSKITKIKFKDIAPWLEMSIILIINIVFAVVFHYIKKIIPLENYVGEIWESVILGIVWSIIYAGVFYKTVKKYWIKLKYNELTNTEI